MKTVIVHFYSYESFKDVKRWQNRVRLFCAQLFTRYVHCNYEIDGKIYDISTAGRNMYDEASPYRYEPECTVMVSVEDERAEKFVNEFYLNDICTHWLRFFLGALPVLDGKFINCANFSWGLFDVKCSTPDKLFRRLVATNKKSD